MAVTGCWWLFLFHRSEVVTDPFDSSNAVLFSPTCLFFGWPAANLFAFFLYWFFVKKILIPYLLCNPYQNA